MHGGTGFGQTILAHYQGLGGRRGGGESESEKQLAEALEGTRD